MIAKKDRDVIIRCAKRYNVASVYLFGSSLSADRKAADIDLGVKGVVPALFFKFYGELMRGLSKPVDVIDLSKRSLFNRMVEEKGVKIYG